MKINLTTILGGAACGLVLGLASASGSIITTVPSGPLTMTVPDGSPVGIASTIHVSGLNNLVSSGNNVILTLNVSGGYNGDLVAYLSYGGTTVTLLNRPGLAGDSAGLGYMDPGYNNVILSDGSHPNINSYGGSSGAQVTGTYNPSGGSLAFQSYNGMNPNGNWALSIFDMSGGDTSFSQLTSWSLTLTAVPEPVNVALAVFGAMAASFLLVRRLKSARATAGK